MQKVSDQLLEIFMWVYELFLYSLILPLTIGVITLFIPPIFKWYYDQSSFVIIGSSVIFGIGMKIWRNSKKKE